MTNEELIKVVAGAIWEAHGQIDTDDCIPIAQAAIEALAPMMREVVDVLEFAKRRIGYLGVVNTDPRHYEHNESEIIPKIDKALASLPECWKGEV
jgi:hypothetical protein